MHKVKHAYDAGVSAVAFLGCVIWQDQLPARYVVGSLESMERMNSVFVLITLMAVSAVFVINASKGEVALEAANLRINELLNNVLPQTIAERLTAEDLAVLLANPEMMQVAGGTNKTVIMVVVTLNQPEWLERFQPAQQPTILVEEPRQHADRRDQHGAGARSPTTITWPRPSGRARSRTTLRRSFGGSGSTVTGARYRRPQSAP